MRSIARPSQRQTQRAATRRSLLAAARTLFRADGVDTVSMDDIARAAAVGRATVYLHFSGKQALLAALLAEDWASQVRLFRQIGRSGNAIDAPTIAHWLGRVIEGMRKARGSFGIHRVALGQDAEMAALHRAHRRSLATALQEELAPGRAVTTRLHVEALMIVAEVEYLAAAAVTEWSADEAAVAIDLVTDRIVLFAQSRQKPPGC